MSILRRLKRSQNKHAVQIDIDEPVSTTFPAWEDSLSAFPAEEGRDVQHEQNTQQDQDGAVQHNEEGLSRAWTHRLLKHRPNTLRRPSDRSSAPSSSRSNPSDVVSSSALPLPAADDDEAYTSADVHELQSMGFERVDAVQAMDKYEGNMEKAIEWLVHLMHERDGIDTVVDCMVCMDQQYYVSKRVAADAERRRRAAESEERRRRETERAHAGDAPPPYYGSYVDGMSSSYGANGEYVGPGTVGGGYGSLSRRSDFPLSRLGSRQHGSHHNRHAASFGAAQLALNTTTNMAMSASNTAFR